MWSIWGLLLKFGVKQASKSCQDFGQKDVSKLDENCVKRLQQRHCRDGMADTAGVRTAVLPDLVDSHCR
jgi:hypothetical protein